MQKRQEIWQQLKGKDSCEVLILGGGINGTGLLRDLAAQGISCVLVDKSDFTAGASSTSSRMIHRGVKPENYRAMLNALRLYGKADLK